MLRAIEICGEGTNGAVRVSLRYEERYRRRAVLRCEDGEDILLDLPEAAALRDGDALVLEDGRHVRVVAASEPLLEVRVSAGAAEGALARLAWHIGNRHTPCQIDGRRLLIQRDPVLEDMLQKLGAETTPIEAPFQPEGGAYGHGRTHGHSHAHDPQADPNAHIPHRYE